MPQLEDQATLTCRRHCGGSWGVGQRLGPAKHVVRELQDGRMSRDKADTRAGMTGKAMKVPRAIKIYFASESAAKYISRNTENCSGQLCSASGNNVNDWADLKGFAGSSGSLENPVGFDFGYVWGGFFFSWCITFSGRKVWHRVWAYGILVLASGQCRKNIIIQKCQTSIALAGPVYLTCK